MGKDKPQNVIGVDMPGTFTGMSREYIQIWTTDIYVNRKFFKYYTLALLALGAVAYLFIRLVNVDILLLTSLANLYMQNIWLFIPTFAIIFGSVYIMWHEHESAVRERKHREELQFQQQHPLISQLEKEAMKE